MLFKLFWLQGTENQAIYASFWKRGIYWNDAYWLEPESQQEQKLAALCASSILSVLVSLSLFLIPPSKI